MWKLTQLEIFDSIYRMQLFTPAGVVMPTAGHDNVWRQFYLSQLGEERSTPGILGEEPKAAAGSATMHLTAFKTNNCPASNVSSAEAQNL